MGSNQACATCPKPLEFARMDTGEILRGACKAWACPSCGPKRRAELSYRIRHGLRVAVKERGGQVNLLTLTLDPRRNWQSAANGTSSQARYASNCWRRLSSMWRERCRRKEIPALWFVRITEWRNRTKALHYHVLLVGWLPGTLREDVVEAGFGKVHDVQGVRVPEAAARYLTKYVTKTATEKAPAYVNRYSFSRDALPPLGVWTKAHRLWPYVIKAEVASVGLVRTNTRWWRHPHVIEALEVEDAREEEMGRRAPKGTKFRYLGSARPLESA